MKSSPCQLHQPLAWREFVARIDSLYCNYLIWCASSNNIFFISIFWQKDKLSFCQAPIQVSKVTSWPRLDNFSNSIQLYLDILTNNKMWISACVLPLLRGCPVLDWLMGKKRQKVQWFPVDGLQWANGEDQLVGSPTIQTILGDRSNLKLEWLSMIFCHQHSSSQWHSNKQNNVSGI